MQLSSDIQRLKSRRSVYYFWVGMFFAAVFGSAFIIYYATQQIDYIWRWKKVPTAFWYQAEVETQSYIEGEVESITKKGQEVTIAVKGEDETETYAILSDKDIRVTEGDFMSPGDILGTVKRWRPGILLQGMWVTLKASFFAIIFGVIIGIIGGIARISSNPAFKWTSVVYVEFIRGTPLLVQLFIWYFVLGTMIDQLMDTQIPPLWYGIAALACFAGAYVTEIVRAGIQSIHRGQVEASRSLGMSYGQCMYYIILPQALRRILPPLAGQFISLIKDSSLLGIIAVRELTKATREVITVTLQTYEFWFTCALLYLILTFTLSMFVQYLERRTSTR